jgi:hypothetical protein
MHGTMDANVLEWSSISTGSAEGIVQTREEETVANSSLHAHLCTSPTHHHLRPTDRMHGTGNANMLRESVFVHSLRQAHLTSRQPALR